jgi:Mg2+ and Co2+ transporter CorA
MIVDNAIYVDGRRTAEPSSLHETHEAVRRQGGLAWIGLHAPTEEEFSSVAAEFGLHPLAVEDAVKAHQRPKIERYDGTLFVVLRPARYVDETETVEFGEVHVFVGEDFVVSVRHGEASELGRVRERLEGDPGLLRLGPEAVLYAVTDRVVDDYAPVVAGLENDIDEIETARSSRATRGPAGASTNSPARSSSSRGPPSRCPPSSESSSGARKTPSCRGTCATSRTTPCGSSSRWRASASCCRTF